MTRPIRIALFVASLVGAAGLGAWAMSLVRGRPAAAASEASPHEGHEEHEEHAEGVVEMPPAKQESAGIAVEPARRGDLTLTKWVTGKVAPNEDRLAHIYSLVEGTVHAVEVGYGDRVRAGDVLAMIDSKEVGQAKLDSRAEPARRPHRPGQPRLEADDRREHAGVDPGPGREDHAAGDRRAVPRQADGHVPRGAGLGLRPLFQTRAEFERTQSLSQRGSISQREFEKAKADFEAAQATYNALKEQARFTTEQELIQAQQTLEQAKVAEGASRSALYILGYGEETVGRMDPLGEGEEVAHYAIHAPFDGTILEKDVVVEERVGPQTKLFDLADLATVWVQADIYEKDLAGLEGLQGKAIRFRSSAYAERTFAATVFYTGEVVDPETRTVRMMAEAENPDRLLKPGLFVEIELPVGTASEVVQVPTSAVQTDEGETFVFVRQAPDEFVRRDVILGREGANVVEVVEGLRGGEPVAVQGAFALKAELKRGELAEGGHHH